MNMIEEFTKAYLPVVENGGVTFIDPGFLRNHLNDTMGLAYWGVEYATMDPEVYCCILMVMNTQRTAVADFKAEPLNQLAPNLRFNYLFSEAAKLFGVREMTIDRQLPEDPKGMTSTEVYDASFIPGYKDRGMCKGDCSCHVAVETVEVPEPEVVEHEEPVVVETAAPEVVETIPVVVEPIPPVVEPALTLAPVPEPVVTTPEVMESTVVEYTDENDPFMTSPYPSEDTDDVFQSAAFESADSTPSGYISNGNAPAFMQADVTDPLMNAAAAFLGGAAVAVAEAPTGVLCAFCHKVMLSDAAEKCRTQGIVPMHPMCIIASGN